MKNTLKWGITVALTAVITASSVGFVVFASEAPVIEDDFLSYQSDSGLLPETTSDENDEDGISDALQEGGYGLDEQEETDGKPTLDDLDELDQEADAINQADESNLEMAPANAGAYTVGDGVTADFDESTGALVLFSNNGTLWKDWVNKARIEKSAIKSIKVSDTSGTVYLPEDSSGIFQGLSSLTDLELRNINTANVFNMFDMFSDCKSLTNLDLSSFDTNNVTNMSYMFAVCTSLTNLDLSSFV